MATRTRTNQQETASVEPQEPNNEDRGTSGRGWHGDPQGHAAAGRKGGQTVSQDKEHMASIGRKGGQSVSRDRQHMASIGRKGGQSRSIPDEADAVGAEAA